jgi:hypothetical protein
VGRKKNLWPDGHSGQRKLHCVLGSMDKLSGKPQIRGRFINRESAKEIRSFRIFKTLNMFNLDIIRMYSFIMVKIINELIKNVKRRQIKIKTFYFSAINK